MRSVLNTLKNFRIVFLVLGLSCLLLVAASTSVEAAPSLFTWDPDPIEEGAGDVT